MTSPQRQLLVNVLSLADIILLATALYVSVFERHLLVPFSVLEREKVQVHTIAALVVLLLVWKVSFSLMGFYRSKRLAPALSQIPNLLKGAAAAAIGLAVVSFVLRVHTVTFAVLLRFLPLAACMLIAERLVMRQTLKALRRRGRNLRQVVVVGTNARALEFVDNILSRPELGYRLAGFVDNAWIGPPGHYAQANLVSDLAGFRAYLRSHVIDEVVIALPIKSFYQDEDELLQICREHGVVVRVLTNFFGSGSSGALVNEVGNAPVVTFSSVPFDALRLAAKRTLDIVGSALLILLVSPIMLSALVLIKMESRGPAIFTQERIGLNKRRFLIYKFRTMVVNAEKLQSQLESRNEAKGPVFKIWDDPRITRIGKFLRKTSIDELPQLFNVLKGNMSLVGPRPLPVRDYTGFSEDWQRRRFSVRPGITCLWQISGRSSISFEQWMRLDMEYIDQWSLWLDIKILAKTIPAVLRGAGAA